MNIKCDFKGYEHLYFPVNELELIFFALGFQINFCEKAQSKLHVL